MSNKVVDNRAEQRIERESMIKEFILKNKLNWDFESDPGRFSMATQIIFPAMQEYADLRCKPLVEALEKIIELKKAASSTQDLYPVLQEIDKAKKALQDYNKK